MRVVEHPGKSREAQGTKVVDRVSGHYEAKEAPFGMVYRWHPACVMIECRCGERLVLSSVEHTCNACAANHATVVLERLRNERLEDKDLHPWRYAGDREGRGIPF